MSINIWDARSMMALPVVGDGERKGPKGSGSCFCHASAERGRKASWYAFQREALERGGEVLAEIGTKIETKPGLASIQALFLFRAQRQFSQFPSQWQWHGGDGPTTMLPLGAILWLFSPWKTRRSRGTPLR